MLKVIRAVIEPSRSNKPDTSSLRAAHAQNAVLEDECRSDEGVERLDEIKRFGIVIDDLETRVDESHVNEIEIPEVNRMTGAAILPRSRIYCYCRINHPTARRTVIERHRAAHWSVQMGVGVVEEDAIVRADSGLGIDAIRGRFANNVRPNAGQGVRGRGIYACRIDHLPGIIGEPR